MTLSQRNDKRIFALLSLWLLLFALLVPFCIAACGCDDLAGGFGLVAGVLALVFGALSWSERIGKTVAILVLLLFVGGGTGMAIFTTVRTKQVRVLEQAQSQAALNQALAEKAKLQTNADVLDKK
jgi:di/tricarboxylate transporter